MAGMTSCARAAAVHRIDKTAVIRNTTINNLWSVSVRIICILLSLLWALPASSHEYWIEPKAYVLPPDTTITAGLHNGQKFAGSEFTFLPRDFRRFDLALGDTVTPVQGRMGDRPALAMAPLGEGLHVAVYETVGDYLTYQDFALFTRFVTHKDFRTALARHSERALPQTGFKEFYTRHAKSLIAVGGGAGADRAYGLETEIVALKNPYTDDISQGVPVRLLYKGALRVDAQIELFDKDATGVVNITLHRTDANGEAVLPVIKGHSYLVDAVVLREPVAGSAPATKGAVWESLWAALTFAVP